ncbi:hypothetical protein Trydic_g14447, partial [Trypoxylus dichotomus]
MFPSTDTEKPVTDLRSSKSFAQSAST